MKEVCGYVTEQKADVSRVTFNKNEINTCILISCRKKRRNEGGRGYILCLCPARTELAQEQREEEDVAMRVLGSKTGTLAQTTNVIAKTGIVVTV